MRNPRTLAITNTIPIFKTTESKMWGHRNTGAHSPIWARDEICAYSRTQCFPDRAGGFADTLKPVNIQGWVRDPHVETEVPGTYLLETLGRHLNLRRQNQHRLAVFLFVELLIPVLLDTAVTVRSYSRSAWPTFTFPHTCLDVQGCSLLACLKKMRVLQWRQSQCVCTRLLDSSTQ